MKEFFTEMLACVGESFSAFKFTDFLDILVLSVVFFGIYHFLRDRRASNLFSGILVLLIAWALSKALDMHALAFLLRAVFSVGLLAIIVIFQPEIRTALEKVGDRPWRSLRSLGENKDLDGIALMIESICSACSFFSKPDPNTREYTGALIVIERTTKLGDILESGVKLDAELSATLFHSIFYKGAPMHDGAAVIRDGRLAAAACMLPLTTDPEIGQDLGSRHRAAIGMSEVSDAVIVVVSEETGTVSMAYNGGLTREYSISGLQKALEEKLIGHRRER